MKILIVLLILLSVGCNKIDNKDKTDLTDKADVTDKSDDTLSDTQKIIDEYKNANSTIEVSLNENANVKYLEKEKLIDFLNKETGIVYLGFPTCPWCRNILPVLMDFAYKNNVKLYYFNVRTFDSNDPVREKLITILSEYLEEGTLYVPDVYFIKDGKIVGNHLGSVSSQTNPYEPLTDSQKEELKNIYQGYYELIK